MKQPCRPKEPHLAVPDGGQQRLRARVRARGPLGCRRRSMETPSWFIADSSCNTIESARAEEKKNAQIKELEQMFPDLSVDQLKKALGEGGDLLFGLAST